MSLLGFILSKTSQFILVSSLLFLINTPGNAQPLYQNCGGEGNYTANSGYETSLKQLLETLFSSPLDYYQTAEGPSSVRVFGLFLCRGDVGADDCKDCVKTASEDILQLCPYHKVAFIWYDNCLLRYSNQSFFSTLEESPLIYMWNTQNTSDPITFDMMVLQLMNNISSTVGLNSTSLFATGEADLSDFQTIYGLVQCTRDISKTDCKYCLDKLISQIPASPLKGKQGGRMAALTCNFRFELYPFYNSTVATPPPPPPASTTPTGRRSKQNSARTIVAIVVPTVIAVAVISYVCICSLRRKANKKFIDYDEMSSMGSLQFEFSTIAAATCNFCTANKLGEGGFGSVYKGRLYDGQEIAVKRLSMNSGQGAQEFKNEVELVAKLQHRNLVRLLGYCLEGQEKILIYEYIANTSLDKFLFDPAKQATLKWDTRCKIIGGIARGLLYLHEDSRLRIVHRDLKASNILLDDEMTPKIADFGMARLFRVDQNQGSTNRIVGTYGYMSPEYAMHGQFSVKSDVYSFGVLLLEIISGQKNSSVYQANRGSDLPSYAWRKWTEGMALELIDPTVSEHCPQTEIIRGTHIGLLCVQEDVDLRPTMSSVVHMLSSDSVTLPSPSAPGYFVRSRTKADQSMGKPISCSINEMSVTEFELR